MRFAEKNVVMFDLAGIPIVGCMQTGRVIGLTDDGEAICKKLLTEDIAREDVEAVDPALLSHLESGGFFDGNPKRDERILSAYLHITQRCNLDCIGCYSLDGNRNALADAPLHDIEQAICGLSEAGIKRLIVSGGEPFLRDDLPEIAAYAKTTCGIAQVTVLSNGMRITTQALERLAPHVDCVSVSFDG